MIVLTSASATIADRICGVNPMFVACP